MASMWFEKHPRKIASPLSSPVIVARTRRSSRCTPILCVLLLGYGLIRFCVYCIDSVSSAEHVLGDQRWAYDAFTEGSDVKEPLSVEETERLFLSVPDPRSALAASREYATHPHIASSPDDYEDALVILKLFQDEFGIPAPDVPPVFPAGTTASRAATLGINKLVKPTAWVDVYYPIMNTPLDQSLQILAEDSTVTWNADLAEDGNPIDPDAAKYKDSVPTFHGFSEDGDVTGELIYANYGRPEDYDELLSKGANFTDKIVIVRYGEILRGLKIKGAEELGAVGVLIYSDPRDDGVVTVENGYIAYPLGPARNPTAVERGSVQFISQYPGDPSTPGYPAYENATREEAGNVPSIPSLPISWANAQRLLEEISPPAESRKLTGLVSKSATKLVNHVENKVMPIWNTVAAIPGHIKTETVLLGCHRDAWVMGAADPTSGTVSLHEVIRGFGTLLKKGWKPLRNIVIISWDAEEYGVVGSTEYAEDFADWISQNVVAYINLDVSVMGSQWHAAGSPSLAHLARKCAQDIPHPTIFGRTLWDARLDNGPYQQGEMDPEFAALYEASLKQRRATDTEIPPLGSGSDFIAFLQHLGIASMDQSFFATPYDAVYHYHSIYDTQRWQELYADPGFSRHVAVAQHLGLIVLRLSDSVILPFNTTQYALELSDYAETVEDQALSLSLSVNFSPLHQSVHRVQKASYQLDIEKSTAERKFLELLEKIPKRPKNKFAFRQWIQWLIKFSKFPIHEFIETAKRVQKVNGKLAAFEKGFISEEGIKDREWYKHLGVAPGKWLGYGATTLPSIYDAIVWDKNATAAQYEVARVAAMLERIAERLLQ